MPERPTLRAFEVFGDDMFGRFLKEGLLSTDVGRDYRREILEPNGTRPAEAMVSTVKLADKPYKVAWVDGNHNPSTARSAQQLSPIFAIDLNGNGKFDSDPSAGEIMPRSGCGQRTSASQPVMRPVLRSISG